MYPLISYSCHDVRQLDGREANIFIVISSISISLSINCNTRCYCSSYSTSTVASTVFIQWWLQYKPNSMKMIFSTNGVGSFWVNLKVGIFELLRSVDHWAQSNFFCNLMEWNWVTLPKERVFSISWSTSMQIFNNSGAQEVIVSSVQIELQESISRLGKNLTQSDLTIITFGNCISSRKLGDNVCISTWWESNIYSSIWNTPYQFWISGVIVVESPTSLSGQLYWI